MYFLDGALSLFSILSPSCRPEATTFQASWPLLPCMRKVRLAEFSSRMSPADVSYPLADALGTTKMSLNYYELGEGDSTAFGYHAHADQEEVFYVQSGTVTFRTEDGSVRAKAGELVRFGPGEFQRAVNEHADRAIVLAVGAPRESGETTVLRFCEECGEETQQRIELADDHDSILARCDECGEITGRFTDE